jgi:CRP/FNR family cyclic AMP-dependent transcriptional regulator
MPVAPAELRKIPLFANITDAHLAELVDACRSRKMNAGESLFEAGAVADRFLILVSGELSLREGGEERFRLRPIAPVGELGTIAKLERRTTAVAATPVELLEMPSETLMQFFEDHGDVAFPVHYNLLRVVADKVRRDHRRVEEMRKNIITTQKAMKRMRDALLEGEDTPLHKQLFDELEALIEQNKKGHYLVEPAEALPTRVRLDSGQLVDVKAISKEGRVLERRPGVAGARGRGERHRRRRRRGRRPHPARPVDRRVQPRRRGSPHAAADAGRGALALKAWARRPA